MHLHRGAEGTAAWRSQVPAAVSAFDAEAAAHAGDIRAALERQGMVIGSYDLMIAGHAPSRNLTLVTSNLGEFRRVDGLRSEDWTITGSPPA